MKKHVTVLSVVVGIALFFTMVVSCSSGSGGNDTTYTNTANGVGFNMISVPGGATFTMGEDVESTTQAVTLTGSFSMGETEVTQGLWMAIWGTWPGPTPWMMYGAGDNIPAYNANWYEAAAFCNLVTAADGSMASSDRVYYSDEGLTAPYTKTDAESGAAVYADPDKRGYRLPTEAEWEYAARYVNGTNWAPGNSVSGGPVYTDDDDPDKVGDYAWYTENNTGLPFEPTYGAKEAGLKKANALGLRDMSGNVSEWCHDWYGTYGGGSVSDPEGPTSGSSRVLRGGEWNSAAANIRCAGRDDSDPTSRIVNVGFRLCRTAD